MNPGTFETFTTAALLLADTLYNNDAEQFPVDVTVRVEHGLKVSRHPETHALEVSGSRYTALAEDCTISHETYILASFTANTEEEAIAGLLKDLAQKTADAGIKAVEVA